LSLRSGRLRTAGFSQLVVAVLLMGAFRDGISPSDTIDSTLLGRQSVYQREQHLSQIRAAGLTLFKLGRNRRRVAIHNEVASRELRRHRPDGPTISVSAPGYLLLLGLEESEPSRVSDLAHSTVQDLSAVVRQVQTLEKAGLVTRSSSPDDGRTVLISRTPAGKDALEALERTAVDQIRQTVHDWSDEDVQRFAALFARFVQDSTTAPYET
jgi:DNA-binding MarR family transcriptional regulator